MSSTVSIGDFSQVCAWIESRSQSHFFIVDRKVNSLYPNLFRHCLNLYLVDAGEDLKSLANYERILDLLLKSKIDRSSHIVAVGGGTVSDFTGFIAATILRGISWSVIPTTLLSMVDAAIGGKTGLNHNSGKNLIGAFHFPKEIISSEKFLGTLEKEELESGAGEVIKYAFLDKEIFNQLLKGKISTQIIQKCIDTKIGIISKDPLEKDIRKVLNLGHTWGHAIEKQFSISHGKSVLFGLKLLFMMERNTTLLESLETLAKTLKIESDTISLTDKVDGLLEYISADKKRTGDRVSFVFPDYNTIEKSRDELRTFLVSLGDNLELS